MNISLKIKLKKVVEEMKSSSTLQKVNDLYFESKENAFNEEDIGGEELNLLINVFQEGDLKVREFVLKWYNEEIRPSDQELDILLILCDEAANNWDLLATLSPSIFTEEKVKKLQREIKNLRKSVLEEKFKRKNVSAKSKEANLEERINLHKRIDKLQNQINFLKSKGIKGEKVGELERKKSKLEDEMDQLEDKPTSATPSSSSSFFSLGSFLIGVVICEIIIFISLFFYSRKSKE